MSFYLLEHSSVNGTQWQQWGYPRRGATLSGTCIMHTSESALDVIGDDSGAEDVARFIGNRTGSYGSYHNLVDSNSIIELAPFEYETWQDSETNPWAVGISAACRTSDWATMSPEKAEGYYRNLAICAADFVVYMRDAHGITVPLKRITGAEARARKPGFCAHGDSGIARTDPGVNFDWDRFFRYTKEILEGSQEMVYHPQEDWYAAMIGAMARLDKDALASLYVKGDDPNEDSVYDITGGVPRGLTIEEWEVLVAAGQQLKLVPQAKLNAWLAQYNARNPE